MLIELEAEPPEVVIGDRGGEPTPRGLAIGKRDDEATANRLVSLQQELVAILGGARAV